MLGKSFGVVLPIKSPVVVSSHKVVSPSDLVIDVNIRNGGQESKK